MRLLWTSLTDSELPFEFAIVPLTGHLVRRTRKQSQELELGSRWLHQLLGWRPALRMRTEVWPDLTAILDPEPVECSSTEQRAATYLTRSLNILFRYLPLLWVIRLADWLPAPRDLRATIPNSSPTANDYALCLAKVAQLFGRRTKDLCLLKSIERRTYLRWLGIASQLRIGVFVPTEEMHAWIEIAQQPVLESPDFLVHYRVAITID